MLAIALMLAPAGPPTLRPEAIAAGRDFRVGDLVEGRVPAPFRSLVALRLPARTPHATMPAKAVQALLRRRVPALAVRVPPALRSIELTVAATDPAPAAAERCSAVARDLPAGTALSPRDLTPVACRDAAARAAIRYLDGATLAAARLPAGTYLGRIAPPADDVVASGTAMTLRATAGPVVIERPVVTAQTGRAGGRVFVRDATGAVFAAPLGMDKDTAR